MTPHVCCVHFTQVTKHQLWKQVYNKLGGNPRSTSAATCTRRHYEKLILPFERHLLGGGSLALSQHRPQKRSWSGSLAEREEESAELKMAKHRLQQQSLRFCQPSAAVREKHQDSVPNSQVRLVSLPVAEQMRQYYKLNPSLTRCQPGTLLTVPRQRHYQPTMQPEEPAEGPKQQLVLLRHLAQELILPFERHLLGGGSLALSQHRPQKRSWSGSLAEREEELTLQPFTANVICNSLIDLFFCCLQKHQDSVPNSQVRLVSLPVAEQMRQYYKLNPSLTRCQPGTLLTVPRQRHYQPTMQPEEPAEGPKQQLVLLRHLAQEYTHSSCWAEPLNLSLKPQNTAAASKPGQPLSLTPEPNGKVPKFLNTVSPLYASWNSTKEDAHGMLSPLKDPDPIVGQSFALQEEVSVIDLMRSPCSVSAGGSASKLPSPNGQAPQDRSCSIPSSLAIRGSNSEAIQGSVSEPCKSHLGPLNPQATTNKMEIQIPFSLLQSWFRSLKDKPGSIVSPNSCRAPSAYEDPGDVGRGSVPNVDMTARPLENANDQHFQRPYRGQRSPEDDQIWRNQLRQLSRETESRRYLYPLDPASASHLIASETSLSGHPRYTCVNGQMIPMGLKVKEWEDMSDCHSDVKTVPDAIVPSSGSPGISHIAQCDSIRRVYGQQKHKEDLKHYSFEDRPLQRPCNDDKNLVLGGSSHCPPYTQGYQVTRHPSSIGHVPELQVEAAGSRSLADGIGSSPLTSSGGHVITASALHQVLLMKQASPTALSLTRDEYLKLRRLIPSSP
ncbi:ARI5B protein, partial [Polyodon spathula]|nr:ARI5B protein [Polyodon spathula]